MERKEIFDKLNEVFCDVLDLDEVKLTDTTNADDIEEWDSISVVGYMGMANATCGKRPSPEQVRDCASIRDLYNLLSA